MSVIRSIRSLGLLLAICGLTLLPEFLGLYAGLNRIIGDMRMALSPKAASGQVIFVAVDARSLDAIGQWPWSRSVHADILNRLVDSGASDILFDFDFAFPSDPEGDADLEQALERAGGATLLAVFEQRASLAGQSTSVVNTPIERFAMHSWPALINVTADEQGIVRTYPYGAFIDGQFMSSPGALFAGQLGEGDGSFEIDFAIQPDTVPVVSAIDVINGALPAKAFAGRSVIVGAGSVELSDQLSVPVHGIVPGPMIHALATETLMGAHTVGWVRPGVVVLVLFGLLGLIQSGLRRSAWMVLAVTGASVIIVELGSLALYRTISIQVPSAMLYPSMISFGLWRLTRALSTSRRLLETTNARMRNTLNLLEHVFHDSSDGIVVLDESGTLLRHSASAGEIFGTLEDGSLDFPERLRLRGRADRASRSPTDRLSPQVIEIQRDGKTKVLEYHTTYSALETPLTPGAGNTIETITTIVIRDVTRLVEQEQDIAYLSSYDERTGALRRGAFLSLMDLRLEDNRDTAVFALSLPRFKTVNVTLGRDVGDALLKEVVARIERSPLHLSSVARLGGTRFALYTEDEVRADEVRALAESILNDVSRPYNLPEANAHIGVHLGCVTIRADSNITASKAIEQAEEALDTAKNSGTPLAFYERSGWVKQRRAREIERAMVDALANEEFNLLYQPQHRVSDGKLVGAEALIRWESPKLGTVYPDEFIGIAESTGFIVELGRWTLKRAAMDALTLPSDLVIAVNVSGIQILQSDFARDVTDVLASVGLPASRICLELTETVLLASTETIIETMQDLRFSGFTWALDDFGTGFSSMEYLSKMPLDKIKLDKSFTLRLEVDPTARPILHSTSELCHGLGVKLLCEGVETREQLRVLVEEDCAEAQGYLFGKPMPVNQLITNTAALQAGGSR